MARGDGVFGTLIRVGVLIKNGLNEPEIDKVYLLSNGLDVDFLKLTFDIADIGFEIFG